jgi:predicted metal-dependent enzyme (double-stranded beta helix superfamily)
MSRSSCLTARSDLRTHLLEHLMSVDTRALAGPAVLDRLDGWNPSGPRITDVLRLVVDRLDWQSQVRFAADQRWFKPIVVDGLADGVALEAWLLSWLPGQRTGLHDHGGSAGAFAVVRGALREDTVQRPAAGSPRLHHQSYTSGQVRPFGSHHLHEVVNDGIAPAVSIHVYAPRLTMMTRYRWTDAGPEVVTVEKAGSDW